MIYYDQLKSIMTKMPVPNGYGAGKPLELMDWQDKILLDIFGTENRPEICYIEIPRKNGKTTFTGALLNGLFVGDPEPGAEFYCASGDKEQAGIIFNIANYMISQTKALSRRIRVVPSTKKFVSREDPTRFFKSLSSDAHSKHGYNPYFTVFDELHIFRNRDLWDVMDTGDVAREKPMKFIITTAGTDMATLCGEFHEYAMDIINGKVPPDPNFKPYVFTVKDEKQWENEEQWAIANPSMGKMLKLERLRAKYLRAKGKPVAEAAFKRLHLNIWQESQYAWISIDDLVKQSVPEVGELTGAIGGLDLGFGADTTSFTLYSKKGTRGKFRTWIWITEREAEKDEKDRGVPWSKWVREGYVRTYGKDLADYDILESDLLQIIKEHRVKKVAFDRWKTHHLINKLARRVETVPVGQGFVSMTMPVKYVEALINAQHLAWQYNPAVREAFKKVYIKQDASGNAKPDKQKSWHKIDPVASLLTAVAVAESQETKESVYNKRGIR